MFYEDSIERTIRFGDIIKGLIIATPNIEGPDNYKQYNIGVEIPENCVILSPCCSIGDETVLISPLLQVRNSFFGNAFLAEDLTRINRKMTAEQAVPPQQWAKLTPEEKERRAQEGLTYAFVEVFVYDQNELFKKYTVHRRDGNITTASYMIDFRNIHKLDCAMIKSPTDAPIEAKCLQLSIETRSQLREKLAAFYGRIPKEDLLEDD
ncbi:MAG: hypothetical protein PHR28_14335 [candidate division Zixibacteria bacterium]|nr:hypothetical protein [candidate division Zixibacteria bacterium]